MWTNPFKFLGLTCSNERSTISPRTCVRKVKGAIWFHIDFSVEKKNIYNASLYWVSTRTVFYILVHNLTGWPVIMLLMQNASLSPQLWMAFIQLAVGPNSSISPPWFENFREQEMTSPSSSATFHCSGGGEVVGGVSEKLPTHTQINTHTHTHTQQRRISSVSTLQTGLFFMRSLLIHVLLHLSLSLSLFPSVPVSLSHSVTPPPLLWLQECKKHIWNLLERGKGEN